MTPADDLAMNAVRLVSRHLEPGEVALEAGRSGTHAAVVSGPTSEWSVRLLDAGAGSDAVRPYRVYDAAPSFVRDATAGKTDGFALLSDGRSFHLNRASEFRAFVRSARMTLSPLDLARMLALYQGVGDRSERVVERVEDVVALIGRTWPDESIGVAAPRIDGSLSAQFTMSFHSMSVGFDGLGGRTLDVTAWDVSAGSDTDVTWSSRSVARGRPVATSG